MLAAINRRLKHVMCTKINKPKPIDTIIGVLEKIKKYEFIPNSSVHNESWVLELRKKWNKVASGWARRLFAQTESHELSIDQPSLYLHWFIQRIPFLNAMKWNSAAYSGTIISDKILRPLKWVLDRSTKPSWTKVHVSSVFNMLIPQFALPSF